jgi:SH3-like domain-containing protein
MALLAAKYRLEKAPPVTLSPNMRQFYEPEARELHRRVNLRTKEEVAYRMGTKYKSAVQWCLNLEGPVTAIDFYNTVAIPLDDLCSCSGQQV